MDKRIFVIVPAVAALMVMAIAGGYSINKADEKPQGCQSCHVLREKLPDEHPLAVVTPTHAVMLKEVKYCLECHSAEGSAVAFDWIVHLNCYSSQEFEGDCWSCHMIDEKGNYTLYGADKEGIEMLKEDVDSMSPYYESWATSEYEDHIHAQAGVTCTMCHASFFPKEEASMEQCQRCHGEGYTSTSLDLYVAHHYAPGRMCSDCHKTHDASQPNCYECHYF